MKYDFIEEKVKDLVRDLQWAERDACCEDDYQRLTDIAEDIIGGIPRYLLLIDYWTRYATRCRLPKTLQHDTKRINEITDVICNNDTVSFNKSVALHINKDIKQYLESENGLQEQTKD
jgi:hypothetical protein